MNSFIKLMIIAALISFASTGETFSRRAVAADQFRSSESSALEEAAAQSSESNATHLKVGERIDWQVVASGGDDGASAGFRLSGTTGQTAAGPIGSTGILIKQGFWQDFGGSVMACVPGDADGSSAVDIDDVVYLIRFIFSSGPPPTPEICCGDADASGGPSPVDIDDVVFLIAYIFAGGSAPALAC